MHKANEIKFKTTAKGGRRAYYWSGMQFRWFPIALAEAEMLVATGQAKDITATAKF